MVEIDVLTLFPEAFAWFCRQRHVANALAAGSRLTPVDLRMTTPLSAGQVDDTPFGGGAGMVMRPDVADAALAAVADGRPLVCLSPRGRPFTQAHARRYAAGAGVILLCGRYEGVDQRVVEARGMEEVSIGDFVLSGGELPAMAVLDAAVRLLSGVMGATASAEEESFATGLLEYSQFTRPAEWQGRRVPEVLLSGHHAAVAAWRRAEAERITRERRPDLWDAYMLGGGPPPVASGKAAP